MLALLANWRVIAAGALVGGVVVLWAYVGHLQREAAVARSERDAALSQVEMREAEVQVVERFHETERIVTEMADPIIHTIQESTGAETPVPDDVLANWRNGINSLRDHGAGADDPGSAQPR